MFDETKFKAYLPEYPFKRGRKKTIDSIDDEYFHLKTDSAFDLVMREYGRIRLPLTDDEKATLKDAFGTDKLIEIERQIDPYFKTADRMEGLTWDELLRDAKKRLQAPLTPEETMNDEHRTCTLKQFIESCCNVVQGDAIESKVQLIYKAAAANPCRITLPKEAVQWRNGKARMYFEGDLKKLWSSYTKEIPSLFRLK